MEKVLAFIGDGDFTQSIEVTSNDEIGNMSRFLNATLDKIKNLIKVIKAQATELANVGTNLSSNMTETAAAINQITANIQSILVHITQPIFTHSKGLLPLSPAGTSVQHSRLLHSAIYSFKTLKCEI
jgi:phage-related minor tail protein